MAIHLHLGPLSRLYAETGGLGGDTDIELIRAAVTAWQRALAREVPGLAPWDDSPTAPFDEATVGDTAWQRLREAAGGSTGPDLRAWALEHATEPAAQFLLPDLWLPATGGMLFQTRDLRENTIWVGSSSALLAWLVDTGRDQGEPGWILATYARRSESFGVPLAKLAVAEK